MNIIIVKGKLPNERKIIIDAKLQWRKEMRDAFPGWEKRKHRQFQKV